MLKFVTTMPAIHKAESAPVALPEHTRVRLLTSFAEKGLRAGEVGTIVHVYEDNAYEVEFVTGRSRPEVVTVERDDVEAE